MIETRRLKNVVIFVQTILSFVRSKKIIITEYIILNNTSIRVNYFRLYHSVIYNCVKPKDISKSKFYEETQFGYLVNILILFFFSKYNNSTSLVEVFFQLNIQKANC